MKYHWIAVCVGQAPETGRLLASCLTFWASNRFEALHQIGTFLPDHDNWVAPDGTTRPYKLFRLEQCPPREAEERAMLYMQSLYEAMQDLRGPTAHSA